MSLSRVSLLSPAHELFFHVCKCEVEADDVSANEDTCLSFLLSVWMRACGWVV